MFPCSPQWTYSPCISLCHRYIFLHCSAMSNTSSTNISSLAHLQTFASYIKSHQILQVIYSHFIRCHASSKYCASHILAPYEVIYYCKYSYIRLIRPISYALLRLHTTSCSGGSFEPKHPVLVPRGQGLWVKFHFLAIAIARHPHHSWTSKLHACACRRYLRIHLLVKQYSDNNNIVRNCT